MTQIIDMPAELARRISNQNLWLRGRTGTAGKGTSNREQILFTENRTWVCPLDLVALPSSLRLTARLLAQRLNGRVNILRVPVCNRGTLQYLGNDSQFYEDAGISAEAISLGYIGFSDGSEFSDGSGFALPTYDEPTVSADAAEGATSISLSGLIGAQLEPGARFSINDFLYQVDENTAGVVTFAPPLRESVAVGDAVKVSYPTIQMRLTSDDGYEPFEQFGRQVASTTLMLEEEFERV